MPGGRATAVSSGAPARWGPHQPESGGRQLLQHTNGLPNYTEHIGLEDFARIQHKFFHPHDLLTAALAHPAEFAPGAKWKYSNTNYLLAGMLIEKVTERPVQEQITERVIRKAGLRHTSWPQPGDRTVPEPHARGYARSSLENGKVVDATRMAPSWGGAAGQLISTPSDLATFARLLLDGKLLAPGQPAEMRKTVDAPIMPGWRYGLGVLRIPLSCGGAYWGHGDDIDGYETRGGATDDGPLRRPGGHRTPRNLQRRGEEREGSHVRDGHRVLQLIRPRGHLVRPAMAGTQYGHRRASAFRACPERPSHPIRSGRGGRARRG
ncbi:serine hydrolase domain-containing protein [Streptomyces parvus]|uniref:serine hydrolase domain-containing protein n=1 Tax=Streptomyces parvus TaxID=66428 RepID=UPI0033A7756A